MLCPLNIPPYISADEEPKELTLRVLIVGVVLGILMTAANAYLGLYAGMTVSASIPAAVMSMLILRSMFKDVSILENNAVQTMASAGESLAAGVIFTVPAMLVIGIWIDIEWFPTLSIALLGGVARDHVHHSIASIVHCRRGITLSGRGCLS